MRNLDFIHAALPEWTPPPNRFDAVVTHFFLDCFAPGELGRVVGALATGAKQNAAWLVSDFAVPSEGFARHRARAVHALMYAFFRRLTHISARAVTPPDSLLQAEGFQLANRASVSWGLLHSDCWKRHGVSG